MPRVHDSVPRVLALEMGGWHIDFAQLSFIHSRALWYNYGVPLTLNVTPSTIVHREFHHYSVFCMKVIGLKIDLERD